MLRATLLALLLLGISAVAADRSGKYEGTYTSDDGESTGKLRIVIQKSGAAAWVCNVFFSAGDDEIATKPGPCSLENDTIVTEFDADVDGSTMHATLKGSAVDDKSLAGTYATAGHGEGGKGTWKVTLRP